MESTRVMPRPHWKKEDLHSREAEALYKGRMKFDDIRQMIRMAAWGAANERAYGADATETKESWKSFKSYVAQVLPGPDEL